MIKLYWKNVMADVIGQTHGITQDQLDEAADKAVTAHDQLMVQWEAGKLGYVKLPGNTGYRDQVMALVEKHRAATDLVVLGIGGSALGNAAIQQALRPLSYNLQPDGRRGGPRLFVLDNVDPALVGDTLDLLGDRLSTTVFNVISKSGETAETASQFMIVRELLRARLGDRYGKQIVATTDARKGTLHGIAAAEGFDTLPVPGDVGGRFSVLSPVGLFSAAMCGIDIDGLLAGAAEMAEKCKLETFRENPATVLAAICHTMMTAKGKPIHVMMPYSNRLYGMADWYRQIWAESLGKEMDRHGRKVFAGPTPIKALGATDQHSQVQLYREGPNDKLVVFLELDKPPADLEIPDVYGNIEGLAYLRKVKLSALLSAEKTATEYALAKSQRPTLTIRFDALDANSVGAFIMLYEVTTSLMGLLLDINAYDQPAVELGKQAIFALIGRKGYEKLGAEIKKFAQPDPKFLA